MRKWLENMLTTYKKIYWTEHSKIKMRQYGLSRSKLLQIVRKPERKEAGIVMGTVAVMQAKKTYSLVKSLPTGRQVRKPSGEIWLMYKDAGPARTIISAWRYPGISKPGENIPVPEEIRQELLNNQLN